MTRPAADATLARLTLDGRADDLLARMDAVTPADGDEMRALFLERGWVEAVRYFARKGLLTPAGVAEVVQLLGASAEWADGLTQDGLAGLSVPSTVTSPGEVRPDAVVEE